MLSLPCHMLVRNIRSRSRRRRRSCWLTEALPLAQEYAAQVIFGGIAAKGKLPVSIPGLYYAGTGVFTEKTRLGYHQPEEVGANPDRLDVIESIVKEGLDEKLIPDAKCWLRRTA